MDELDFTAKPNRYSKFKNDKIRDLTKKDRKKSNRLSSIERDYAENVDSADEECFYLGEVELLASLDKLTFVSENDDKPTNLKEKNKSYLDESKISNETECYPVDNFSQFNRDIKIFLKDNEDIFETAPAPPEIRRYIHLLGNLYRLKTYSVGKGNDKRIVLEKTHNSGLANNTYQLEKVIEKGNRAVKWMNGENDSKKKFDRKNRKNAPDKSKSTKPAEGTIVGGKSAPIDEDNVGNQMLQKMGWTPGTGLGRDSTGIVNHIPAVVKTKRNGII